MKFLLWLLCALVLPFFAGCFDLVCLFVCFFFFLNSFCVCFVGGYHFPKGVDPVFFCNFSILFEQFSAQSAKPARDILKIK